MKKLTHSDKRRFNFQYNGNLNDIEVSITITDKITNIKREIKFLSIYNLTNEAVENILKENIETIKCDTRDLHIKRIIGQ